MIDVNVGVPLYQDLNGPQLESDYRVMLAWSIEMPAFRSVRYGLSHPERKDGSSLGFQGARRMRVAIISAILGAGLMLSGCSGHGRHPDATRLPDAESPGARLFVQRCGICHDVPHPARHDYAGWRFLPPLMERRMVVRGMAPLSAAERDTILAYLGENAR